MAQRTVALYDDKYVGIETIYTVINGQQINIPEKLKELREKSRRNELFCPCGCGANLILVAGDRNLREQHFRVKSGIDELECKMPTEGKISVDSKIVLKCWLDDKLKASDLESRVLISTVEDTKRKPEFTFLSKEKKLAIRYWYTRTNIMDDRLDILADNLSGIKVIYIVDKSNGGGYGQYPEALMKIQDKQGYILLLSIKDVEYNKAFLTAVYYDKDIDGLWQEVLFAEGRLNEFEINNQGDIFFSEKSLNVLYFEAKENFEELRKKERQRRIDVEKENQEYQRQKAETEKRLQEERRQREENFRQNMETNFEQQDVVVKDVYGNRWVKCEFCGKFAMEKEFNFYGGRNHINLGTCKDCSKNNSAVKKQLDDMYLNNKSNPNECPECGGVLREKNGKFGRFIGCSNYPKCCYTRKVRV